MDKTTEMIARRRMHGLYLSRKCEDITELSRELLGLHCWFHRNVAFSALIRGAPLYGWRDALTKTWLYRGTLHGVAYDDLPTLLALHVGDTYIGQYLGEERLRSIADEVVACMEDGVYSRAEMRRIFADRYDKAVIDMIFSSWGGIFVYLARIGRVAFRSMTSRDFDLIDAAPVQSTDEALPELFDRYITAYGPATLNDAAWFLGLWRNDRKKLDALDLERYETFKHEGRTYYAAPEPPDMGDIPRLTLLSGFDPLIVSYVERGAVLDAEYKKAVVLKSGICLPTIAVDGRVAGIWNLKNGEPVVQLFSQQPVQIERAAWELVDEMRTQTAGRL